VGLTLFDFNLRLWTCPT